MNRFICDGLPLKYCDAVRGCLDRAKGLKFIPEFLYRTLLKGVTRWRIWLRHGATNRKIVSSIRDGVFGIFH
jgi:hypothetical protein